MEMRFYAGHGKAHLRNRNPRLNWQVGCQIEGNY